jgi:subtilisin
MTHRRTPSRVHIAYRLVAVIGTLMLMLGGVVPPAQANSAAYIVVLKSGVSAAAQAKKQGLSPTHVYTSALSGYSVSLSNAQLAKVKADPSVAYVAVDTPISAEITPSVPTEPATQIITATLKRIGAMDSPTAHIDGVDERVDVDVAILDTGIDVTQPDLNVVGGVDCTSGKGYADQNGHGTMVAGDVGAIDNEIGVVGPAPGARLWSVRVLNKQGVGAASKLLCGIDWVTAHADVIDVANMSLAGKGRDDGNCGLSRNDPIHQAICGSVAAGVTYVAAAGNESVEAALSIPASYDEVITVSAFADSDGIPGGLGPVTSCVGDPDDTFSVFSNFGGDIDLSAPGECITSVAMGGGYAFGSGTSFAAPRVAGAVALYLATHPSATPAQVRAALIERQESGPIAGDPDEFPEGIVNVAGL